MKNLLQKIWFALGILILIWNGYWFVKVKILNEYGLVSNVMMLAVGFSILIVYILITIPSLLIKSGKKTKKRK